jgi:hypothetical protein
MNGQEILGNGLQTEFSLPDLAERVVECSSITDSMKEGNLTDRNIHEACEQLMAALRYAIVNQRKNMRTTYIDMTRGSEIKKIWDVWVKSGKAETENTGYGTKITDKALSQFLSSNYKAETMIKDFSDVVIGQTYLAIVIDENRGVIRAKLDKNYNIIDLEDIGVCLYLYSIQNPERYRAIVDGSPFIPIFICNLSQVPRLIDIIDAGSDKLLKRIRTRVEKNPALLPKELLFNEKINTL